MEFRHGGVARASGLSAEAVTRRQGSLMLKLGDRGRGVLGSGSWRPLGWARAEAGKGRSQAMV